MSYKSTEKDRIRETPAWRKKKLQALWNRYQAGKITRAEYDQGVKEIHAMKKP